MYKEIDSLELNEILRRNNNINLIDIRDSYSYISGSIANAKNIPSSYLISNPDKYLDKNKDYYLFCNYGSTSRRLCQYLTRLGYQVINITDGYKGYEDSI